MIPESTSRFVFDAIHPRRNAALREAMAGEIPMEHAQAEKRRYDSRQARGAADLEAQRNRCGVQLPGAVRRRSSVAELFAHNEERGGPIPLAGTGR